MDGIAKTSLLTAAMRALETKRSESEGRLFVDPYAEQLAGKAGMTLAERAIAEVGDQPAIAIRTYFIDQKMNEAIRDGVRQFVILAAGMDTRAYRLRFAPGTQVFELDRQEVLDYKNEKLSAVQAQCTRQTLPVDLREDWQAQLLSAGFRRGEPTLWLVEGLLMYLEEAEVLQLFGKINSLATSEDRLVFDILSRTLLEAPHMKKQLEFLASLGAPWKFGVNDPEKFMQNLNWIAVLSQAGECAPSRWPFPTAPLSVPNVPRGFFVAAKKSVTAPRQKLSR